MVIDPDHLANPDSVTAFGQPPHRIDLLAGITGVTYDEAAAHAITVELAELPLRVIGLDALRANKRATGRQKDLDDLRRLPVPPMR
ncbi:MAG: hypothetical protein KJT01_05315 [Gemmatimonadetes bacterium]|nr:hypothetical protein [Gemmatimonadota bacterium]